MSSVMGLDLAYGCTGICVHDKSASISPPNRVGKGIKRQIWIRDQILEYVYNYNITLVVQEDYAFRAKGRVFHIGELGGIVKLAFYTRKIDVLVVPPSTLKQYATGKGNASKDEVMQFVRRVGYEPANADEADASVLYDIGVTAMDDPHSMQKITTKCKLL